MRNLKPIITAIAFIFMWGTLLSMNASAQLLINEIEADPGNQQNDSCQYIELRGTPGSVVPDNTYFVSIDSDQTWQGRLHNVVALGGKTVGQNGLLYLVNTLAPACPNRVAAKETTVVEYSNHMYIGGGNLEVGSESFVILQTPETLLVGQDADTDDDGELDIEVTKYIDAVAFRIDPDQQYVFPSYAPVLGTRFTNVPDAFVRFPENNTPFSADAYYYGEISDSPTESVQFVAPLSSNFPQGGVLTPGDVNVPAAPTTVSSRADFDGDGKTDVSVFRPSTGNWWLLQSGDGLSAMQWGLPNDKLVPADYDGDGKTDVAVYRASEGAWYIFRSSDLGYSITQYGSASDIPVVGDYDGDGKADIALYRPSSGVWYIRRSSDEGETNLNFGSASDIPVPADYDGDGLYDPAIYRDGQWWINGSSAGQVVHTFGNDTDIPTPGDFDGDGKTDVAVYRPNAGTWYILRSSDQNASITQFGAASDIPVPGDYDGDGRDDIAIFRNGQWWINGSTSGLSVTTFGLGSDIPLVGNARP